MSNYIRNPETNRWILVDGPAYNDLLDQGYSQAQLAKLPTKTGPRPGRSHAEGQLTHEPDYQVYQFSKAHSSSPKATTTTTERQLPPYKEKRLSTYKSSEEGRGSRTRGRMVDAPQRGRERHLLKNKCGDKCFLDPENEAFPICPRCQEDDCSCQIDCRGLAAAKVRAYQWKNENLYGTINKLERDYCRKDFCSKG